jgi:Haem-NO-binding
LINKAIQELLTARLGEAGWRAICLKTDTDPVFVSMAKYPDEVTYKLVAAASEALDISEETILEQFGEYWTVYTAEAGYGPLLQFAGSNLFDFLQNLDNMHTRVALTFPELEPPSFWCSKIEPRSLRLHYRSTRPGLAPLVLGLIKGLGKRFGTPVTVTLDRPRSAGQDHDQFIVRYADSADA